MAKPWTHAKSSAKKFGGIDSDYIDIHNMMDSSKSIIADNRHRTIFHSSFGILLIEKLFGIDFSKLNFLKDKYQWTDEEVKDVLDFKKTFGTSLTNSDGRMIPVRSIGEQHVLEDFGMKYIPSAQDYLENMEMLPWMNNGLGESPNSVKKLKILTKNNVKD